MASGQYRRDNAGRLGKQEDSVHIGDGNLDNGNDYAICRWQIIRPSARRHTAGILSNSTPSERKSAPSPEGADHRVRGAAQRTGTHFLVVGLSFDLSGEDGASDDAPCGDPDSCVVNLVNRLWFRSTFTPPGFCWSSTGV